MIARTFRKFRIFLMKFSAPPPLYYCFSNVRGGVIIMTSLKMVSLYNHDTTRSFRILDVVLYKAIFIILIILILIIIT